MRQHLRAEPRSSSALSSRRASSSHLMPKHDGCPKGQTLQSCARRGEDGSATKNIAEAQSFPAQPPGLDARAFMGPRSGHNFNQVSSGERQLRCRPSH